MSMFKEDVIDWLKSLPAKACVAIDEGGLSLVEVGSKAYLEVGGIPEEDV